MKKLSALIVAVTFLMSAGFASASSTPAIKIIKQLPKCTVVAGHVVCG